MLTNISFSLQPFGILSVCLSASLSICSYEQNEPHTFVPKQVKDLVITVNYFRALLKFRDDCARLWQVCRLIRKSFETCLTPAKYTFSFTYWESDQHLMISPGTVKLEFRKLIKDLFNISISPTQWMRSCSNLKRSSSCLSVYLAASNVVTSKLFKRFSWLYYWFVGSYLVGITKKIFRLCVRVWPR